MPSIDTNYGKEAEERSIERQTQWIAVVSRDHLTEQILKNDCVCSRHFVPGKPAKDSRDLKIPGRGATTGTAL